MQTSTFIKALAFAGALLLGATGVRADYPLVSHRYAAEPTGIEWNGRLYLFCSNDDDNNTNSYLMHSIVCFSTDDLKNWTDHGVVFDASSTSWAGYCWAPSVVSNNNTFYLYFGNGVGGVGVATSSVPTGPFTDALGGPLVGDATPGAAGSNQWYFDPCAFVDDDGQGYLYFGGNATNNARVLRLNSDLISVNGAALPMDETNFFRASQMHKRNGIYYFTYSSQPPAQILCMTNSNPLSGFQYSGMVLDNPPYNFGSNSQHSFFTYKGAWYCAYHNRIVASQNGIPTDVKRNVCLDAASYGSSGALQTVSPTADGLAQLKSLNPYARVEAETLAQQSGVKPIICSEGGLLMNITTNGSWIRVRGVDFGTGASQFLARVACNNSSGNRIELHLDSLAGTTIGTCAVGFTGGPQTWTNAACAVSAVTGAHDLYMVFKNDSGSTLFNFNWWRFVNSANPASSASPAHQYSFNETGGSSVADSIGGALWAGSLPNGGTFSHGQLTLASNSQQYVSLPAGIVAGVSNVTVASWVKINSLASWTRIFDFGNSATNYMYLTPQNGADSKVRFAISTNGASGEQQINGKAALSAGAWHFVAVTLNSGVGVLYVDGSAVGSNTSMTLSPADLGSTARNYIGAGQSNYLTLNAALDEFRIFNAALSGADIGALYALDSAGSSFLPVASIDTTTKYQTIEGIGGATGFYAGWLTAHPYKQEIYSNVFAGLNLSMLRLGNWFRYSGAEAAATEIVAAAKTSLGRDVPVYMSSWAPPAFLKANGNVAYGNSLIKTNGAFAYSLFANYWYDSLMAYKANGVVPTWISIQNEPDWIADYDSCIFHPTEDTVNGTNYASYSKALDAVYAKLSSSMTNPPKLLGPETVHFGYNDVVSYAATMNSNSFYGICHHLYGDFDESNPMANASAFSGLTNTFPNKPRFSTEYGVGNMMAQATLLHLTFVNEQASGYNYWSLVWPGTNGGLVQIENPYSSTSTWTNAPAGTKTQSHGWWIMPAYYAIKHYSYFITPGFKRVAASSTNNNVLFSAYISTNNLRVVAVLINQSTTASALFNLDAGGFAYGASAVYQTSGTNYFQALGALPGTQLTLPAQSLTTVVLDKSIDVGAASKPVPINNAVYTPVIRTVAWTPGSNAVSHAVYLGTDSNVVAAATTSSPEYLATVSATNYALPLLAQGATYYWRVDEMAGASVKTGTVWRLSTVPASARAWLKFDETGGTTAADATGNGWNGTLFGGATFVPGYSQQAVSLNPASSQYVSLPSGLFGSLGTATIATWVKLNSVSSGSRIFDFGTGTTAYMYLTPQNGSDSRIRFGITTSGSSGEQQLNGSASLTAGAWRHVAVTLNSSVGVLYVDGVPVATNKSMTLGPSALGSTTKNYIGKSQFSTDALLNGMVDEFQIFGTALAAPQVAALAQSAPPAAPTGLRTVIDNATVQLYWYSSVGASQYVIKRATTSGGPYSAVGTSGASPSADAVPTSGAYYYVVCGANGAGQGANSSEASALVDALPFTPIGAIASADGLSVTLSWPESLGTVTLESSVDLQNWQPVDPQPQTNSALIQVQAGVPYQFFRLQRE